MGKPCCLPPGDSGNSVLLLEFRKSRNLVTEWPLYTATLPLLISALWATSQSFSNFLDFWMENKHSHVPQTLSSPNCFLKVSFFDLGWRGTTIYFSSSRGRVLSQHNNSDSQKLSPLVSNSQSFETIKVGKVIQSIIANYPQLFCTSPYRVVMVFTLECWIYSFGVLPKTSQVLFYINWKMSFYICKLIFYI